ncbi:MAG TPA: lysylphosphatidylglycerol synthase domain-containing protein [Solirubrobacteraceae bacterium]|nr:lysylphosphatidylglycerol synthase domain-containing protein [Solirubrobacteraceae bacterium]
MSLEPDPTLVLAVATGGRGSIRRRKIVLSVLGALTVSAVLGFVLAGRRAQFVAALRHAPLSLLAAAALLQVLALLARSEAWNVCVREAGGTVARRVLFRAAGVGYLASVLNGSLGMAARIASLRRACGDTVPRVPALVAAEIPIITIEVVLAAVFSFTLIAPLGIPWWAPAIAVVAMAGVVAGLCRVSRLRQTGLWAGLAVLRCRARGRMILFTLLAVCAQVGRNWLMLHAIGVDVSVLAAMAWLIAMFTLGQLPIGPSIGPAAAVLILGSHGVAATAAAGVLVAVTGTTGSLGYAAWAIADQQLARRARSAPELAVATVAPRPG